MLDGFMRIISAEGMTSQFAIDSVPDPTVRRLIVRASICRSAP